MNIGKHSMSVRDEICACEIALNFGDDCVRVCGDGVCLRDIIPNVGNSCLGVNS